MPKAATKPNPFQESADAAKVNPFLADMAAQSEQQGAARAGDGDSKGQDDSEASQADAKPREGSHEGEAIPAWIDFVAHITKHGDKIIQARYPNPRAEVVDTIWRGVPIFDSETVEYRYLSGGWIEHDCV
jgi:hypothetical protein